MRLNLSSANSRIRDVDVASETSQMSRNQVLSQAGLAVLAHDMRNEHIQRHGDWRGGRLCVSIGRHAKRQYRGSRHIHIHGRRGEYE